MNAATHVPNYFLILFRKSVHSNTYTDTYTDKLTERQTDRQRKWLLNSFAHAWDARGKNAKHDQALEQLSLYALDADIEYKGQMILAC